VELMIPCRLVLPDEPPTLPQPEEAVRAWGLALEASKSREGQRPQVEGGGQALRPLSVEFRHP
jgi:hypothetical protein